MNSEEEIDQLINSWRIRDCSRGDIISELESWNDSKKVTIVALVIEDFKGRETLAKERYGSPMTANTKLDGLQNAYEEALDLCVYLKKELIERNNAKDKSSQ